MTYQNKLIWLIAITTVARVVISATEEFGTVEAYYWALATKLQWNYFDHPPIVAWLIRLTTANLLIHNEIFVRLGAVISSAICTWLVFKIGSLLCNERTGWLAALLYSTSIYSGIGIAAFILPDSPQMVFWLASLYTLLKIIRVSPTHSRHGYLWCLFGILCGLCIMCKVHGVFLWIGAVSYFLIYDRGRLKDKYIYVALGITILIVSPIFIWNMQNHFISYKFHSGRVDLAGAALNIPQFVKQFFSIVFLTGPIHFFLVCSGVYLAARGKLQAAKGDVRLIILCSLPLIVILLVISLFREVLPHWPEPALSTLFLLPAVHLAANAKIAKRTIPGVLKFAMAYALLIVLVEAVSVNYFPGTLSMTERTGVKMGSDDATLDMYGWRLAGLKFDSVYKADRIQKIMPASAPILVTDWGSAAHIDFYIAHGTGRETYGLGSVYSLHQYFWMNSDKRPLLKGDSAYYVVPSNLFTYKAFNKVVGSFREYHFALIFPEYRSGMICRQFYIVRLTGYKGQ